MTDLQTLKAEARQEAFARRKAARSAQADAAAAAHLIDLLLPQKGRPIAGYMPIRTEIDPRPAMAALAAFGPVAVPVIDGEGLPLRFKEWTPTAAMKDGPFGAKVPVVGRWIRPEIVIMPLVAFTATGARLGYGGGFYDRTLENLRADGPVLAIGYAYSAQQAAELPIERTDQPMDMIVTELGITKLSGGRVDGA